MPFVSGSFQVGTQAEILRQENANLFNGIIKNIGNRTAYLGAEDVSVANGFPFEPGEALEVDMHARTAVYAVSTQGGTELRWITVT